MKNKYRLEDIILGAIVLVVTMAVGAILYMAIKATKGEQELKEIMVNGLLDRMEERFDKEDKKEDISFYIYGEERAALPVTFYLPSTSREPLVSDLEEGSIGDKNKVYYKESPAVIPEGATFREVESLRYLESDPAITRYHTDVLSVALQYTLNEGRQVKDPITKLEGKAKDNEDTKNSFILRTPLSQKEYLAVMKGVLRAFGYNRLVYEEDNELNTAGYESLHCERFSVYVKETEEGSEVILRTRPDYKLLKPKVYGNRLKL